MDVDLPVWTIRPNWRNGILERLEWLTDVMISDTGVEQRAAVRLSPRRSFEYTVNPTKRDRSYLDLLLHALGSDEWLVPLWHDQAKLVTAGTTGDLFLAFDNTYRELVDDGYALLFFDAFTWEVVQIDAQDDEGVNLTEALEADWPKGTKLFPLRRMQLSTDTSLAAITRTVGQAQLLWTINESNDREGGFGDMPFYSGAPLITLEPNRSREINLNHVRLYDEQDGEIGLRYRTDSVNRAFAVKAHDWMIRGRQAQSEFRNLVYGLRGRQQMVWMPSFNEDVTLSAAAAIGVNAINIDKIGLGYAGGPIPGRTRIWTGKEVLLHSSMGVAPSPREERLGLGSPTTHNYAPGASGSFLEAVRLDTDTLEIQHHTDSDGVIECGATFRTFANDREADLPIHYPIPAAAMSPASCGMPPTDNPCRITFPGWFTKFRFFWTDPCANNAPDVIMGIPDQSPNAPRLNAIVIGNFTTDINERPDVVDPAYGPILVDGTGVGREVFYTFYWPVYGPYYIQLQYPAFTCGSVGKEKGRIAVECQNWDMLVPIVQDLGDGVGGAPIGFNFNWMQAPMP